MCGHVYMSIVFLQVSMILSTSHKMSFITQSKYKKSFCYFSTCIIWKLIIQKNSKTIFNCCPTNTRVSVWQHARRLRTSCMSWYHSGNWPPSPWSPCHDSTSTHTDTSPHTPCSGTGSSWSSPDWGRLYSEGISVDTASSRLSSVMCSPLPRAVEKGRKEMFYLTTHSTHFIYRLNFMSPGFTKYKFDYPLIDYTKKHQ